MDEIVSAEEARGLLEVRCEIVRLLDFGFTSRGGWAHDALMRNVDALIARIEAVEAERDEARRERDRLARILAVERGEVADG